MYFAYEQIQLNQEVIGPGDHPFLDMIGYAQYNAIVPSVLPDMGPGI